MKSISIVIPAYNEEKRIQKTMEEYYSFFLQKKIPFELIVVANNCSDNTVSRVKKFSKKHSNCKLLNIPYRVGKGGAVKQGFRKACKDIVGFTDADNATPPEEFFKVLQGLSEADVAIGSRALSDSTIKNQPFYRRFLGIGFNRLVNLLFGLNLLDTQCGAKVFSARAAPVMQSVRSNFFEFDVELLWHVKKKGFSIKEVAVVWTDSPESKVNFWSIPKMFIGLLKIRFSKTKE
ncbi:glycosyltransferase family 2 protein [Candidatus Micrarchaeota archaeon]|nr:glycosyltransferase family 2 protein [Candidatus Micrarchaeota archaeon]MBU1930719.1 glycosyltransferase family 2 protein [Candidatus Micrarchaeota archaeon]